MSLQLVACVYRCSRCGLTETQRVVGRSYDQVIHVCGPVDWVHDVINATLPTH